MSKSGTQQLSRGWVAAHPKNYGRSHEKVPVCRIILKLFIMKLSFEKIILLSICSFVFSIKLFSQNNNLSPYETARIALADKTIEQMLGAMNVSDKFYLSYALSSLKEQSQDVFVLLNVKETLIYTYCGVGSLFKTEANIMAESLYSDKKYEGGLLKNLQSIGQEYIQKRKKIESTKTESDVAREEEREYYQNGAGRVLYDISAEIKKWATKDQYETTLAYENRIREQLTRKLDEICFRQCNNAWMRGTGFKKLPYDADSGSQNLSVYRYDKNRNRIATLTGCIKMDINEAKDFSIDKIFEFDEDSKNAAALSYATGLCVVDNCIMPSTLKLAYKFIKGSTHRLNPRYKYGDDILYYQIKFHDEEKYVIKGSSLLGLPEEIRIYLKNYTFDYSEYAKQILSDVEMFQLANHCTIDKYEEIWPKINFREYGIFPINKHFYTVDDIEDVTNLYRDECIKVLEKVLANKVSLKCFKDICTPEGNITKESAKSLITQSCVNYVKNASSEQVSALFSDMIRFRDYLPLDLNEIAKAYIEKDPSMLEGFMKFDKKARKKKDAEFYLKEPYYIYYFVCTKVYDQTRLYYCLYYADMGIIKNEMSKNYALPCEKYEFDNYMKK